MKWPSGALNINPLPDCVAERKKLDSVWKIEYNKTVTAMCELLLPIRQVGKIYYNHIKPTNSSRAGDRGKLKFIRVDVATATACLIQHIGLTKLPPGFQEMHEHLVNVAKPPSIPRDLTAENDDRPQRAPKSQEKANDVTIDRNERSRSAGIAGHDKPKWPVTIDRNTQSNR